MTEENTRSLEFAALGLGQAGGNLAAEFHRRGYPAMALNTARVDLRGLGAERGHLPEDARHYIGLNDLDGAGKDPAYGRACVAHHAERIRGLAKELAGSCDVLFLCAGLGGGTGSAIAELSAVLKPLNLPVAALLTLPSEAESGIVKVNAVRAASELMDADLLATFFVDNQRILDDRGSLDLLSYYPEINRAIVEPLHALNTLNSDTQRQSLRSFDGEDYRKVLLSGGVVSVGSEILDITEPPISAKLLLQATGRLVDGAAVLAAGLPMRDVAYLGVVLLANETFLRKTPMRDFESLAEQLKKDTGGGAVYLGLYRADVDQPVLHVVAGTLSLPERVRDVLSAARSEGHVLADKISAEIPGLDVVDLADMQLFRGAGRSTLPPRAVDAPAPPMRRSSRDQSKSGETHDPGLGSVNDSDVDKMDDRESAEARPGKSKKKKKKANLDVRVEMPQADLSTPAAEQELPNQPQTLEVTAPAADAQEIDYDNLQAVYAELIDRFRAASDRAIREEVARRLMHDARSDDDEVRAHAVWAMVSLGGRGFKAALQQASKDPDEEIRSLAEDGLRRLQG